MVSYATHDSSAGDSTNNMPTIANIITVAYHEALEAATGGSSWVVPSLNNLTNQNRILVRPLGPRVEIYQEDGTIKYYEVDQVTIPVHWSKQDDLLDEIHKVNLVASLFKNAWNAHDDTIRRKIGNGKAIVSQNYRYRRGETFLTPDGEGYFFSIYTAISFIN